MVVRVVFGLQLFLGTPFGDAHISVYGASSGVVAAAYSSPLFCIWCVVVVVSMSLSIPPSLGDRDGSVEDGDSFQRCDLF
ncbi:hypothetical protein IGI04_005436 [Brassica rapa subsp. trilocularis]|uniref:Carboxylic ester hydrolase n=1 Tax=Brassica rapa subsp. trilocularis TaxID=1813537 RepID=A0ABQ7NDZ7_BRACM|nr:hypothetical protein IGI04_005436 [Brassica rapa subsp. trilocularis]